MFKYFLSADASQLGGGGRSKHRPSINMLEFQDEKKKKMFASSCLAGGGAAVVVYF